MTPERPPIVNSPTSPSAKWSAVVVRIVPPQRVASQLKIFTPVGIAISIVAIENAESANRPHPGREHVVAPDAEAEEADQHAGVDDDGCAEERLAGERREHLGDDPERRQDQDVDLGVAEDPKEMLPEV